MVGFEIWQHTVAEPAMCSGVGVHSGAFVRLALKPAAADTGVVFVRNDLSGLDARVPALAQAVGRSQLNTEISNASGVTVSTIEHLMAALAACGVDNAVIEIDGPECPIMDGSAEPFVQLVDRAGRRAQDRPRRYLEVLERVELRCADKMAALSPSSVFEMDFEIRYPSPVIGSQRVALAVTETSFRQELAAARTFGFMHEVEHLRARGLAQGGGLDNAVVIDNDAVLNPEGLRMEREFVRHKALDAVGDLYTLGAALIGRFETVCGGHALNNQLCRALLARPSAYRIRTFAVELAEAV